MRAGPRRVWFPDRFTGLFRVRGIIHPPGISLLDGPILKPFEVVIVHSHWFCLVYLDGLHVGNYPSKICHPFWTYFGTLDISQKSDIEALYWAVASLALYRPYQLQWHCLEWQSTYSDNFLVPKRISCWKPLAYSDTFSGGIGGVFLSVLKSV